MAKKINWIRFATRGKNFSVLLISSVAYGFEHKTPQKIFGYLNPGHYRQFNNSRWFSEQYIKKHVNELEKISHNNLEILLGAAKKYQKLLASLNGWSRKGKTIDYKKLTDAGLIKLWQEFFEKSEKIFGALYEYIFVNKFLPDRLTNVIVQKAPDFNKQNYYLNVLFSLDRPSETRKEKESLLTIAKLVKENKVKLPSQKLNNLIHKHLKLFGYLGRYFYFRKPYNYEDIIARLKNFLKKDLTKEWRELVGQKSLPRESRRIVKRLNLDKRVVLMIKTIKEWGYAGNCFDETYAKTIDDISGLLIETAKRLKIKTEQLVEMAPWEILSSLKQKTIDDKFKKELKLRMIESAIIYEKGKTKILTGIKLEKYYQAELKSENVNKKIKELRGQPASPGEAIGKIRLILAIEDVAKVKKGEILAAPSTTPAHVPAMEKAAAIITDEGGLLSHAAIVSHELGIPCIVGLKIATKILRDGDLVEVDANKGIVKIIK